MAQRWSPESWRSKPIEQVPVYPDREALRQVEKQLANIGMLPIVSQSPDALQTFISTEVERWSKIVRQAGIAGTH